MAPARGCPRRSGREQAAGKFSRARSAPRTARRRWATRVARIRSPLYRGLAIHVPPRVTARLRYQSPAQGNPALRQSSTPRCGGCAAPPGRRAHPHTAPVRMQKLRGRLAPPFPSPRPSPPGRGGNQVPPESNPKLGNGAGASAGRRNNAFAFYREEELRLTQPAVRTIE